MPDRFARVLSSAIDVIGNTPVVELSRFTRGLRGRIVAKLEFLNPGFSKKDRIAKQIIEDATVDGNLAAGQTEEGLFVGYSSGANAAAVARLLATTHVGKTIAIFCCDSGLKYLSTDLWDAP